MQTFEEKVRSMSAYDIVMAMVVALTHPPIVNVMMNTFGAVLIKKPKGFFAKLFGRPKITCYGCAATNVICSIADVTPEAYLVPDNLNCKNLITDETWRSLDLTSRAIRISSSRDFLDVFETAIDCLRRGRIQEYNNYANEKGFALIHTSHSLRLPRLDDNYTNADLEPYKQLAHYQNQNHEEAIADHKDSILY